MIQGHRGDLFRRSGQTACIMGTMLLPAAAEAHERFILHQPRWPVQEAFFTTMNSQMLQIAGRVAVIMFLLLLLWLQQNRILRWIRKGSHLPSAPPTWSGPGLFQFLTDFILDRPIQSSRFACAGRWSATFFLRSPALLLIYSAANNSLVMPSYPLEPSTLKYFQFGQAVLAIMILTGVELRLCGAALLGTFFYLLVAFDWKIAVDVLPVLAVAVVYLQMPLTANENPGRQADLTAAQIIWMRRLLGLSFFALGWMKLYNYYLTVGVADNYPQVMGDPMIRLFYLGTRPELQRECWVTAFGMAEVLTGFLLMLGVFSRAWCLLMVVIFSKLMFYDFGWPEIPHIFPISAFLTVVFWSNRPDSPRTDQALSKPLTARMSQLMEAEGRPLAAALLLSGLLTLLAIGPLLWLLTRVQHPAFF